MTASELEEVSQPLMVSVPLVVVLGAVVLLAWRYMGLRVWMAIVCLLFGFFLAATSAAPQIRHLVAAIIRAFTTTSQ